jgi:hypothetical protein
VQLEIHAPDWPIGVKIIVAVPFPMTLFNQSTYKFLSGIGQGKHGNVFGPLQHRCHGTLFS